MISRIISASRYLVLVAVVCIFIIGITLLAYGAIETYAVITHAFSDGISDASEKALLIAAIQLVDLFLLATVLFVISTGLYELFIDDNLHLPAWLEIHNLDDLKDKLIGVVIVVLGVLFLGQVISWDGQRDLLGFGAAIALMVAALTYFLTQKIKKNKPLSTDKPDSAALGEE